MITQASTQLRHGERMTRETFHRLYEQAPKDVKAELINGVVYVAASMKRPHSMNYAPLSSLFWIYEDETPGIESGTDGTILLDENSEPQPDLYLRIIAECGGQSGVTEREFIQGPPELLAQVSDSTLRLDLNARREDYQRCGVREYLIIDLQNQQVRWFDLQQDKELHPDEDGVIRIRCTPGLWIHAEGLLARKNRILLSTLQAGLQSPEYLSFRDKLAQAMA